jgi:predicted phosphodiesterase
VLVSACLVAIVIVVLGVVLAWRVDGASQVDTDLGRVSIDVSPSLGGEATAFVPIANWGLRADALDAPIEVKAELRSLRRDAALEAAEGDRSVLERTASQLESGLRDAVLKSLGWAFVSILVLLALATLIWRTLRPRWLLLAVGGALALVLLAATAATARLTFDSRAFATPTFFANGAELQRILEVATQESVDSEYGDTFAGALRSLSAVLLDERAGGTPVRPLYLASDFHANALIVAPFSRLVGDAPLVIAGDFGQRGGTAEARALAPRAAALGTRVLAVSGNHDTEALMGELAAEGVTVLRRRDHLTGDGPVEGAVVEVDGLMVAGFPDPLAGSGADEDRPITFDDLDDPEAAFDEAAADLRDWFESLPVRPDIVAVHQNGLAQELASALEDEERPLVILTGHDHLQHVDRYGEVVVVDGGSVGAGGIFGAGEETAGFAELQFDAEEPILRSVNLLQVEPFSGQGEAARVVIDQLCPDEVRCSFEPGSPGVETPAE